MQGPSRTPNSILRKRLDKENDVTITMGMRRNKLTRRRVSFAPDEELETKHIFTENFHEEASPAARFGDAAAILSLQQPGSLAPANVPSASATSPGNMSPLSMDLTNNSSEQSAQAEPLPAMPPASMVAINGGEAHQAPGPGSLPPRAQQYAHRQGRQVMADYTRNITINVQPLSALVEEDEENFTGGGVSSGAPLEPAPHESTPERRADELAAHREHAGTPVSPSVMEEMLSNRESLAVKWGNVLPGTQDTVDNLNWQAAVGDATYRHVYGGGPTGDITRALQAPEEAALGRVKRDSGCYRRLPGPLDPGMEDGLGGNVVAPSHKPQAAPMQQPEVVSVAAARAPAHFADTTEGVDATLGILQGSPGMYGLQQADTGPFPLNLRQAPTLPHIAHQNTAPGAPMIMQSLIHSPLAKQLGLVPEPVTVPPQQQDNTTKMIRLEDTTLNTWEHMYGQGRLSVASNRVMPHANRQAYAGVGGPAGACGDTVSLLGPQRPGVDPNTAHTLQMLAETIPQKATFPREMSMREPPLPFAPPPRHATQAKPVQSAAVSRCIADRQPPGQDPTSTTSLDMDLARSEMDVELDAFGVPPEPTMDLGQQQQGAAGGGQRQGTGPVEAAGNRQQQNAQPTGMQMVTASGGLGVMGQGVPHRLAYQELLSILHVTFHEGVCRMSYLPQAEPLPRTVKEIFESVYETVPYIKVYKDIMIDMSQRLSKMQSRVQELETILAISAPQMLAELQATPHSQLEALRLQCGNLKRLCRLRTVHAIKKAHEATLGSLEQELDKFNEQLQLDMQFMTAEVRRLHDCCRELDALTNAMAKQRQENEKRLQEAALKQKVVDEQYQRLLALRAHNAERRALREKRQAEEERMAMETRIKMEKLHEERSALLEQITALKVRRNATLMTPARPNDMALKVERKRKELLALLKISALGMDISNLDVTNCSVLTFKDMYNITLMLGDNVCTIGVRRDIGADAFAVLTPTVADALGTTASALGCTVPVDSLPMYLELVLLRLHRMWRVEQQLEKCAMKYNCMLPPVVEQQGQNEALALNLAFVNGNTATKVSLRMSWEAALDADSAEPELDVHLESMEPAEVRQKTCQALRHNVLNKIAPSAEYLPALCCAMSATLEVKPSAYNVEVR